MSITQVLHRAAQLEPDRVATVFDSRSRSYLQLHDRVSRLAAGLKSLGMQPGDRVGILSLNSDRYIEYYFAVPWAGGWLNPVNCRWAPAEMQYSFNDSETSILIVDDQFAPLVASFRERSPSIKHYVYAGEGDLPEGMVSYEALIDTNDPVEDMRVADDEVLGIFYTGGTTGFPKGAMLTHLNFLATALTILGETPSGRPGDIVWLHAAPMFHLADGWMVVAHTMSMATHVVIPTFNPDGVLQAIATQRVTDALLVPTMIQLLLDAPDFQSHELSSLRAISYGAAPMSVALLERALAALPGVEFCQAYGATELGPAAFLQPPDHGESGRKAGLLRSCGRPSRACELKLLNAQGAEVLRGEIGEIVVRGPTVLNKGYWNKPDEAAEALRDGWMHIGDAGYLDKAGFLYIVDRVKDMIVSGGENIYSTEVEQAVTRHPAVAQCAVIGVPSEEWGEAVHAVIVTVPGETVSAEIIRDHCRQWIAGYKCPRSIELREELPLSGAGKVLKAELRAQYQKQ